MFSTHSRSIFAIILMGFSSGCASEAVSPPAPPVTVENPMVQDVMNYVEFPGSTRAVESVEIRARVSGILESVRFVPAALVEEGEILFEIEKTAYAAAYGQAQAELRAAEADLARAESDLKRIERAIETEAVSEQELDRARANRDMADASVLGAQSRLERARLDLSYTDVRSPIRGLVGRNLVDTGNLVGSGQATLLTTVRNINPVFVYFDAPEVVILTLLEELRSRGLNLMDRREAQGERVRDDEEAVRASVALASDSDFPHQGRIDFIDNTVDPNTGTIQLRAVVPNDEGVIFPGLFVRVRLQAGLIEDAVTIEETSIGSDIGGKYVYVVGDGDVVEQRYIELGPRDDESGRIAVLGGLDAGERYIINGMLRARPGLPVTPMTEAEAQSAASSGETGQAG